MALILVMSHSYGQEEIKSYDQVSFSIVRDAKVAREITIASLYARSEGPNIEASNAEVNRAIKAALDITRSIPELNVQTQDYQTSPSYQNQKLTGWVVQQWIRIESRQPERLSKVLSDLQKTLKLDGISYETTTETRDAAEDRLIAEGLKAFQARAERVTRELGRQKYRIVKLDLGGTPLRGPRPSMRAMTAESAAGPSLEPGNETLSVLLQGTIELQPN